MSWALKRKIAYTSGTILFFVIVIGGPLAYWYFSIPATCTDGIQNQGETAVDKGGPCPLLDERYLSPHAILWSRGFRVRDGTYNAVAYIQNPNQNAGAVEVHYRFSLSDGDNVIVAPREGTTYIMPGGITPVFEGGINTGNRSVAHTYFEFIDPPVWERMANTASAITINNKEIQNTATMPRITADAKNTSVETMNDLVFTAVVFDPAGNAFAASQTALPKLLAGESQRIVFTWPDPFTIPVGHFDIIAASRPVPAAANPAN